MQIEVKFKSKDKVLHMIGGALYEATVMYIARIEDPGNAAQKIYYCISGGCQTYIKAEEDLYASEEEAEERIFKHIRK